MATDTDVITIELEVDAAGDGTAQLQPGIPWRPAEHTDAVVIELAEAEAGHGFGISEMVTIVVTVAAGASSELAADAIRAAVGKVIRNARDEVPPTQRWQPRRADQAGRGGTVRTRRRRTPASDRRRLRIVTLR